MTPRQRPQLLDIFRPAKRRSELSGTVHDAENIHTVFYGPVEDEHPFEATPGTCATLEAATSLARISSELCV